MKEYITEIYDIRRQVKRSSNEIFRIYFIDGFENATVRGIVNNIGNERESFEALVTRVKKITDRILGFSIEVSRNDQDKEEYSLLKPDQKIIYKIAKVS